jgi:hypothetical protein
MAAKERGPRPGGARGPLRLHGLDVPPAGSGARQGG